MIVKRVAPEHLFWTSPALPCRASIVDTDAVLTSARLDRLPDPVESGLMQGKIYFSKGLMWIRCVAPALATIPGTSIFRRACKKPPP